MSSSFLREQVLPVRALVHRLDERSQMLSEMGAELVVADLTNGADVAGALGGCNRMYFGMSLSRFIFKLRVLQQRRSKKIPDFEILVNVSHMTFSQMSQNGRSSPLHLVHASSAITFNPSKSKKLLTKELRKLVNDKFWLLFWNPVS
jgi:hypothetical protein